MSPRQCGWRPAPAWTRPARFWLAWPAASGERERDELARQDCLGLAEMLSDHAAVSLFAHPEDVAECALCTPPGISAMAARHDGRPVGRLAPLWLVDDAGVLAAAVAGSDPLARLMAEAAGVSPLAAPTGLDLGLLDWDGEGTALASTVFARDLAGGRAEAEQVLAEWGIDRVVWLEPTAETGRLPARFLGPAVIAVPFARDDRTPSHAALAANRERLAAARDAAGRSLAVIDLPIPKRRGGCYADSVVAGDLVVVPAFEESTDDDAFARLVEALPEAKLVSYPATFLLPVGGCGLGAAVAVALG